MLTFASHWHKSWLVLAATFGITNGILWAATQELPPPSDLPPGIEWSIPQQLPAPAALPLVQPWPGWQQFMAYREALQWFGGIVLGLIALLILIHLALYGTHHVQPTGRMVKRYSWMEVLLHDLLALSFVGAWASSTYLILAKHVLGYAEQGLEVPFGRLTNTVHIVSGLLFLGLLVALAVVWRSTMRFARYDRDWLKRLGGYFSRRHQILPAGKFNAGQKIWFYASIFFGAFAAVSGASIYYPALVGPSWSIFLYVVHTVLSVALSAGVVVHVYMAVLAHPHAVRGMITGKVDEACLREDHPIEREEKGAPATAK